MRRFLIRLLPSGLSPSALESDQINQTSVLAYTNPKAGIPVTVSQDDNMVVQALTRWVGSRAWQQSQSDTDRLPYRRWGFSPRPEAYACNL